MVNQRIRDPELAALAAALGLRHVETPEEWRENALARLGAERFGQLQARRAHLANNPAAEADFYGFVTGDKDVTLAMLEGRLGYYDAVLPRITELVRAGPHDRILDLGSYAGLASFYLARHFPDSTVLGIERCEGAVRRARVFLEVARTPNVELVHEDYTRYAPASPCDVVLSLQTVPTYLLPQLPSESPERFERGKNLEAAASDPAFPARAVAEALVAARRLAGEGGRVLLHERLPDVARASFFLYLIGQANLRVAQMELLRWQAANEREGAQQAPLSIAAPHAGPGSFDESSLIDLLLPPKSLDISRLGMEQPTALTGADAQWAFHALSGPREEVCMRGASTDRRFHIHLGVLGGARAYVYTCTTSDYRELKICAARYAAMLFQPVVEQLLAKHNAGEIFATEPDPRELGGILRSRFAAFGSFS